MSVDEEKLAKDVSEIKTDVGDILTILKGPRKSDKPGGVVYEVSKNTEFRKFVKRILWAIFTANAGIIVWAFSMLLKDGG